MPTEKLCIQKKVQKKVWHEDSATLQGPIP